MPFISHSHCSFSVSVNLLHFHLLCSSAGCSRWSNQIPSTISATSTMAVAQSQRWRRRSARARATAAAQAAASLGAVGAGSGPVSRSSMLSPFGSRRAGLLLRVHRRRPLNGEHSPARLSPARTGRPRLRPGPSALRNRQCTCLCSSGGPAGHGCFKRAATTSKARRHGGRRRGAPPPPVGFWRFCRFVPEQFRRPAESRRRHLHAGARRTAGLM